MAARRRRPQPEIRKVLLCEPSDYGRSVVVYEPSTTDADLENGEPSSIPMGIAEPPCDSQLKIWIRNAFFSDDGTPRDEAGWHGKSSWMNHAMAAFPTSVAR